MRVTWSTSYRYVALASLLLWTVSLALPAYITPLEEIDGHAMALEQWRGWELLLLGWVASLDQFDPIFAWFANVLLAICVFNLFNNKAMFPASAFIGIFLALTALQPTHIEWGDDHGVNGRSYPTYGAYVWMAAFAPPLFAFLAEAWRRIAAADNAPSR